ncbi:MAG: hypothetical protein IPN26_17705 [Bacteroidetes bacterium]|nr:hypothetical protein [Bacteroidota bacterium]
MRYWLFLRPNELLEKWEGRQISHSREATAISGIQTVIFLDQLDALLQGAGVHHAEYIYWDSIPSDRLVSSIPH